MVLEDPLPAAFHAHAAERLRSAAGSRRGSRDSDAGISGEDNGSSASAENGYDARGSSGSAASDGAATSSSNGDGGQGLSARLRRDIDVPSGRRTESLVYADDGPPDVMSQDARVTASAGTFPAGASSASSAAGRGSAAAPFGASTSQPIEAGTRPAATPFGASASRPFEVPLAGREAGQPASYIPLMLSRLQALPWRRCGLALRFLRPHSLTLTS